MIETSQEQISALRGEQTVSARISILNNKAETWNYQASDIDPLLISNGNVQETYDLYDIPQMQDLVTHETGHYACFEGEGIKLDGSEQVVSQTGKNNEFGWWSAINCSDTGEWEGDCWFSWTNKFYKNSDLNIVFSKIRNEYAIDFDVIVTITVENTDISIIPDLTTDYTVTYNVRDNDNPVYTIKDVPIAEYGEIVVIEVKVNILKWSKGIARAKIVDMYYGQMLEYDDSKIIRLNGVKGLDLLNEKTESKEIEITLSDENEEYNIFNPQGELANLSKGSILSLELGAVIDDFIYYTKIDEYIIDKPKKEQNTLEVNILGCGILKHLSSYDFTANYYDKSDAQTTFDCLYGYETERIITVDDELVEENEQIRTEFGTVNIPDGINKVATAIRGNVLETIDNKIVIKRIKETDAVAKIDIDNMLSSPEITKEEKPSTITINKYAPTSKGVQTIYDNELEMKENEFNIFKYNVDHTSSPYTAKRTLKGDLEYLGEVDMEGITFLEDRALWNPVWGEKSRVVITGNVIEITQTSNTYNLNSNNTEEKTVDSESIENTTQADKVFEWLKSNYNKEFTYKVEIQDAFTYELGDSVWLATNVYIDGKMVARKAIITNIEIEYSGALHYYLTLRGA